MPHHPAWVGHLTGGSRSTPTVHPCLVRQGGCGWLNSTIHTQSYNNMVAERQCWSLSSKSVQPACATVSVPVVMRRVKRSPRLKHTAKPLRISPVHQCRNFDDCRMHTCGRAERASMVSVRTVVVVILDSGRRTSTAISYVKTLDDCGACSIVRAMETRCVRESDASYQCGKVRV